MFKTPILNIPYLHSLLEEKLKNYNNVQVRTVRRVRNDGGMIFEDIEEVREFANQDIDILIDVADKYYPGIKRIRLYMADAIFNYDECCKVLGVSGKYIKAMFKESFLADLGDLYGAENHSWDNRRAPVLNVHVTTDASVERIKIFLTEFFKNTHSLMLDYMHPIRSVEDFYG